MHIFSKEPSNDEDFVAPSPTRTNQVPFNDSEAGEGSTRRSSVTIEPVTIPQPQYEDCNEPAEESTLNATDYAETDKEPPRSRHGSESAEGGPMLDSGYNSASPIARPSSMDAGEDMMPIPVVWADNGSDVPQPSWKRTRDLAQSGDHKRSQSVRTTRTGCAGRGGTDEGSIRTTQSGRRSLNLSGGSFSNGAGMVGPAALPNDEETSMFRSRSVSADAGLTDKQKVKIGKAELKEGKRVVKVMKQEAKAEKKALEVAVKELTEIQRSQKNSIKEDAKTNASYAQALRVFHKEELEFFAARAKYERAQADQKGFEDAREASREHARMATEMLQEKNREVEWLRAQKAADDREREAKIRQLSGKA
ncbi:hypothetical protein EW026_g5563 [Hermanssonia centrifuga]|uniref:DNA binding protein Ncp1 n=1 Tax=Hermanssonia centrifuga TaxID=98765 RepID=A0A4S4KI47_9APHY|nr:hypothetical protein EW026_g5563 [Hermanssonia centrifuga]